MDRLTARGLALVLLLLAASHGDAATIRGVPSCAYWLRDREPAGGASYFNAMWLVGYLSGAAVHSEKDILRRIDSESIAAWMDRYCKENASKNIAEGGEALFDELAGRAPRDRRAGPPEAPALSTADHRPAPPEAPALPTADHRAASPAAPGLSTIDLQSAGAAAASPRQLAEPVPRPTASLQPAELAPSAEPPPASTPTPAPAEPPPASTPTPAPAEPPPPTSSPPPSDKAAAGTPPAPERPESGESHAAAINAEAYLPRALMLANTLPLRNSKYQFKAEQFAKASGCVRPAATLNIRTATSETFAVTCADGEALAVRCDPDCRDLQ